MRRALLLALILILTPAVVAAADFLCNESAVDIDDCTDPNDLATCAAPPGGIRQTDTQRIFREVDVLEGPSLGMHADLLCLNAADDATFQAVRDGFCVRPPAPPLPSTTPSSARRRSQPVDPPWRGIGGGDPGIRGPGFSIRGPDPRIYIR